MVLLDKGKYIVDPTYLQFFEGDEKSEEILVFNEKDVDDKINEFYSNPNFRVALTNKSNVSEKEFKKILKTIWSGKEREVRSLEEEITLLYSKKEREEKQEEIAEKFLKVFRILY